LVQAKSGPVPDSGGGKKNHTKGERNDGKGGKDSGTFKVNFNKDETLLIWGEKDKGSVAK